MKANLKLSALLLVVITLISSCGTKKKLASRGEQNLEGIQRVEEILKHEANPTGFSAKVDVTLKTGGSDISSKGDLRIEAGKAVYLSLQPFLGIEAFRLVVTPEKVLLIDRLKKRFISQNISEYSKYTKGNNPYELIEALFLNRLFALGQSSSASESKAFKKFDFSKQENNVIRLTEEINKNMSYFFDLSADNMLSATGLLTSDETFSIHWNYNNFVTQDTFTLPAMSNILIKIGKKEVGMKIINNKMDFNKKQTIDTEAPAKYEQVTPEDILKSLIK